MGARGRARRPLSLDDQDDARQDGERAERDAGGQLLLGQAEQPEQVQAERREHLPGHEEPDRREGAEPGEEQDPAGDVQRAGQAAEQMPAGHVGELAEGAERARRDRQDEQ